MRVVSAADAAAFSLAPLLDGRFSAGHPKDSKLLAVREPLMSRVDSGAAIARRA
jgi:hypothetical protein